jgi:hypothetical protein
VGRNGPNPERRLDGLAHLTLNVLLALPIDDGQPFQGAGYFPADRRSCALRPLGDQA